MQPIFHAAILLTFVVALPFCHHLEDAMLFLSSDCSSDTRRWYSALSPDTGHDQPYPDFLPCFQRCCTRSTSCVVTTRSRKVNRQRKKTQVAAEGECFHPSSPQVVKCGYGTLRSTQGIGVAGISRFAVASNEGTGTILKATHTTQNCRKKRTN